jgi:hypothetical protein
MANRPFTKREIAIIVAEAEAGRGIDDMAAKLNRPREEVRVQVVAMRDQARRQVEAAAEAARRSRSRVGEFKAPMAMNGHHIRASNTTGPVPPPTALIDRDRRAAARERLDITGLWMGDPPPGYCALDRIRAATLDAESARTHQSKHATTR